MFVLLINIYFMKNFKKGFTLIELMVVIAIIAVLTAVVLVSLNTSRSKANKAAFKNETGNYVNKGMSDCLGATSSLISPADTTITDWGTFTDNCSNGDGTFSISATNLKVSGCSVVVSDIGAIYTGC
jgi:prepilin-type N-terminal cleavage/methylation domain-containing protein